MLHALACCIFNNNEEVGQSEHMLLCTRKHIPIPNVEKCHWDTTETEALQRNVQALVDMGQVSGWDCINIMYSTRNDASDDDMVTQKLLSFLFF